MGCFQTYEGMQYKQSFFIYSLLIRQILIQNQIPFLFFVVISQVHLKFEINAYDPAIVQQLMLSGEQSSGVDSRRPTLAWLEDSSSCSDIPKLEGDRYASLQNSKYEMLLCKW